MGDFSLSGGVEVFGFISPTNTNDTYPVIDPLYGIDGFRNVNTLSDLNNIPGPRRRAGMVVGVSGGTAYYKLNPSPWNYSFSDWSIFNSGGSGEYLPLSGGTVTGNTIFTLGLSANTISATTYQNLPTDIRVTGGTYSNGTTIFTNNTGGTFNVTGFYTGATDVFVTGGTYFGSTITFTNNTGGTFTVTGITSSTSFTGGTVTGSTIFTNGLTANTISATTYQNLPTDIIVTGGTYSNGTTTFTNNTGGTFNVIGFYTGETSFPYLPLSGGTVTGNTILSGLTTVYGDTLLQGLTANTISATTLYGDGSNLTNINNFVTTAITLSSIQILSLGGTVELLPPPGLNKYYVIDNVIMEYTYGTIAYVFPTSLAFYLDGCFDSYIDRTLLTSSSNTVCTISGNLRNTYQVGSGSGSVFVRTNRDVLNSNLIIGTQNNDNPTSGNGTLRIKITYKITTFGS